MAHILYLEDDRVIREVVCEYLLLQDYEVDLAVDGQEALVTLTQKKYDVAILDIMVPFISGLEVLEVITQTQPQCATIMLTALGDESNQLEAFNRLADDYIIKPFSPLVLLKRIEAVLRRTKIKPELTNGLEVRQENFQVYYNQQSLQLTVTEFLIFEAMYQHPKRVYTRNHLLEIIAPDDFMVNDRVIDAHIKNLRKKLPVEVIRTVIGMGYCYEEN
jgi:DNA-binding response OmpR family regulator